MNIEEKKKRYENRVPNYLIDLVNDDVRVVSDNIRRIASTLGEMNEPDQIAKYRVTTLDQTALAGGSIVEAVGIPEYVEDAEAYSAYGITEPGWYIFARILARAGVTVSEATAVTGADGSIVTTGEDHVDVAVRFDVAAMSKKVTVNWDANGDIDDFIFKATDLAVRNLDYRTTFYVYDIAPFATWTYAPAAEAAFVAGNHYYRIVEGEYIEGVEGTDWTAGEAISADTWYKHSKVTFAGMTRNVTYVCNTEIDCPTEFILPEIEDETHGCWYEIRFHHAGSYSSTLTVPEGVKVATEHTQNETKGINMVDLHYTSVDGIKVWRFMNTHSNLPTA